MRLPLRWFVATVFLSLATSCAGHNSGKGGGAPNAGVITREQIAATHYTSAYDVVEALHNNWLRARGTDSFQAPSAVLVYLDDTRLGGVETLRAIAPATIASMRFYDGLTATGRWGVGHAAGVILVATQVGP